MQTKIKKYILKLEWQLLKLAKKIGNHLRSQRVYRLDKLDNSLPFVQKKILIDKDIQVVCPPNDNKLYVKKSVIMHYYIVDNLIAHPSSSLYVINGKVYSNHYSLLEPKHTNYMSRVTPVGRRSRVTLNYPSREVPIDTAIVLSGFGSFNYFHLVFENILRVFLITNKVQCLVLLPEKFRTDLPSEWYSVMKNIFDLKLMSEEYTYNVRKAYIIDYAIHTPYDISREYVLNIFDYSINKKAYMSIKERINNALMTEQFDRSSSEYKYIYVKRKEKWRPFINQDELIEELLLRDFKAIDPANMSLTSQVEIFRSARIIVGGSGAALSNIIFSSPGTAIISWLPSQLESFPIYSTMAALGGIDFISFSYEPMFNNIHSPYSLDVSAIISLVDKKLKEKSLK